LATGPQPSSSVRWLSIAFGDADLGVVGGPGVIERTADGGLHWSRGYSGRGTIWSLRWLDPGHVFAATDEGLLSSVDGGSTWTHGIARDPLIELHMLTATSGFAVGGTVATGSGWLPLNEGIAGEQLLRTLDAGDSWSAVDTGFRTVQSVFFVTAQRGWVAGPEGISTTGDGGRTWNLQFQVPNHAYARDGTPTWSAQLTFVDDQHGFTLYRTGDTSLSKSGKDLYYTEDGGTHWTLQSATTRRPWGPNASENNGGGADGPLIMTGPNTAMWLSAAIASPGTFLVTTGDRGRSWTSRSVPFNGSGVGQFAVRGDMTWAALSNGILSASTQRAVLRSSDGGVTWQTLH
jgi:hypothetical protein